MAVNPVPAAGRDGKGLIIGEMIQMFLCLGKEALFFCQDILSQDLEGIMLEAEH